MQQAITKARNSVSLKAVFIGILVLVLLIPVGMIKGVIHDRTMNGEQAKHDVMRAWGEPQQIAAPLLIIPYRYTVKVAKDKLAERSGDLFVLPENLDVDIELVPDTRYRGIHEVTVYSAKLHFSGNFLKPALDKLPAGATINWKQVRVAVAVSDARAINIAPEVSIDGVSARFEPDGKWQQGLPAMITAKYANPFPKKSAAFELDLSVNGTGRLLLLPLGDTTTASMRSSWSSPSFMGAYLPKSREISEQGFTANWQIASLGRSFPSSWIDGDNINIEASQSEFGVDLFMPIGIYQLSLRAAKYAVLFIGLSFVAYFLFEVIAGLRLHPLQYLLIGFANSLFYLLLLSLAEHIGFGIAYCVSAAASIALITAYSVSVLGQRNRAAMMTLVLSLLYGFLYMTLNAETYAMLAGSIGLWVTLAVIMYLTRKVDWYSR